LAKLFSTNSRNLTLGYKIAQGKTLEEALSEMEETAEGLNTIQLIKQLGESQRLKPIITDTLYKILFEGMPPKEGLSYLMRLQTNIDINVM